jgi:hypothetical protein
VPLVNLRPEEVAEEEKEVSKETKENGKDGYVKTSITLSRATAVRARKYVSQQLSYAQGQRESSYSFSQLFNDALDFYLDTLEKGDPHEKNT